MKQPRHVPRTIVIAVALATASYAHAANKNWNCTNSTWQTSACWSPVGVPAAADAVGVYTVSSSDTLLKIDGGTGTARATTLNVTSSLAGKAVTLQQTGGALVVSDTAYVGYNFTGGFQQSGGTHSANHLYLGYHAAGDGSYTLSGTGSLDTSSSFIGYNGTGAFTQSGGTHSTDNLRIGGTGNYQLSAGTLTSGWVYPHSDAGSATFVQSGGVHNINLGMSVGAGAGSSGSYTLSGGSVAATADLYVGGAGTGSMVQTAGSLTATSRAIYLGYSDGSSGSYSLSGSGTIQAASVVVGRYGAGTFTQSGGTLGLSGNLYIAFFPGSVGSYSLQNGTLAAAVQNQGSFSQSGGVLLGNFVNEGTYTYSDGTFTGRLTNNGTVVLNANISFSNGVENNASFPTIGATRTVAFNGTGLSNNATITMAGGTLFGDGPIVNNASLSGYGTIGGAGGFTNYGLWTQGSGNIEFSKSGTNQNLGNMDLAGGRQFQIAGSTVTFSNAGTVNLNGAVVTGTGLLTNAAGGTITGRGTIASRFGNTGQLLLQSGTTNIAQAFTSTGLIRLSSDAASLAGGALTNAGTIRGTGQIGNTIGNSGTIEASGGALTLAGAVTNTGLMAASAGSALIVNAGLATNAGVISLTGGTFDNNNHTLSNVKQISGYGILRTSGLTNSASGTILLTGGTSTVNGNVTNNGSIEVAHNPAIFTGAVTNNSLFKSTNTTVSFAGGYTENGMFFSDPATNIFTSDVVIGQNGFWVGGAGDQFVLGQDLINHSTRSTDWNTGSALLKFIIGPTHDVALAGADLGASTAGYSRNFAWGIVEIAAGQSLSLSDGNAVSGAALYVTQIQGIQLNGMTVTNIQGNGYNVYYDPTIAGNAYLAGKAYGLGNGGMLAPVPEPSTWAMMIAGLGWIGLALRRARRSRETASA